MRADAVGDEFAPIIASASLDEETLEAELSRAEAINSRTRWWDKDWINKPITIWILATVAVGILTFTYGNYSACRISLETDNSRFDKIMGELSFRAGLLGSWVTDDLPVRDTTNFLKVLLNSDNRSEFGEFRSKFPYELTIEAGKLIRKWYEVPPDNSSNSDVALATISGVTDFSIRDYLANIRQDMPKEKIGKNANPYLAILDDGGLFDLFDVWSIVYDGLDRVQYEDNPSSSIGEIRRWSHDLVTQALEFAQATSGTTGVASSSTCLKRAFWPF